MAIFAARAPQIIEGSIPNDGGLPKPFDNERYHNVNSQLWSLALDSGGDIWRADMDSSTGVWHVYDRRAAGESARLPDLDAMGVA